MLIIFSDQVYNSYISGQRQSCRYKGSKGKLISDLSGEI